MRLNEATLHANDFFNDFFFDLLPTFMLLSKLSALFISFICAEMQIVKKNVVEGFN